MENENSACVRSIICAGSKCLIICLRGSCCCAEAASEAGAVEPSSALLRTLPVFWSFSPTNSTWEHPRWNAVSLSELHMLGGVQDWLLRSRQTEAVQHSRLLFVCLRWVGPIIWKTSLGILTSLARLPVHPSRCNLLVNPSLTTCKMNHNPERLCDAVQRPAQTKCPPLENRTVSHKQVQLSQVLLCNLAFPSVDIFHFWLFRGSKTQADMIKLQHGWIIWQRTTNSVASYLKKVVWLLWRATKLTVPSYWQSRWDRVHPESRSTGNPTWAALLT